MTLQKLPLKVQSKFRSSIKITSFKTAIQELVYNALDADSTSVAIRVHIPENYIQVVDNGCGVTSNDLNILGQRYATSKFENPCTIKSIQKYGCYGQSLANLVEVSESVKITSKCQQSAETWTKHFIHGREEGSVTTDRASIGTTVEIKGFLYNLPLHKKAVKPLEELQNVKLFLEQMSLVHCNTSISLRDDSKNEIIFKTHKNRNIVQTLASVLNIETNCMQEFQVEKNMYKVIGFIQKKDNEPKGYKWIFVNGRCIGNSNLHKLMNENLATGAVLKDNVKIKGYKPDEEKLPNVNTVPDYFLFINCPPDDYEIISNPKQFLLEFKNNPQVCKLLEKLAKFHKGDITLISTTKKPNLALESIKEPESTRNKVKLIMHKILGSQRRKINGSNLRNGVKGKKIKRKGKKKAAPSSKTKSRFMDKKNDILIKETEKVFQSRKSDASYPVHSESIDNTLANGNQGRTSLMVEANVAKMKVKSSKQNLLLSNFEKGTDEILKRCNMLAKRVDNLLAVKKKRKCKIFTNETVQYSKIVRENKSISVRKRINEIITYEYIPLARKIKTNPISLLSEVKTSTDLIHPVMNIVNQTIRHEVPSNTTNANMVQWQPEDVDAVPGPTFQSHGYYQDTQITQPEDASIEKYKIQQFISKFSRDNFTSPGKQKKIITTSKVGKKPKYPRNIRNMYHKTMSNGMLTDAVQSSYSIHFSTKSDARGGEKDETNLNLNTYTVDAVESSISTSDYFKTLNKTIIPQMSYMMEPNNATKNICLVSEGSPSPYIDITQNDAEKTDARVVDNVLISNSKHSIIEPNDIEPLEICETVISSHSEQGCEDGNEEYTFVFDSTRNIINKIHQNDVQSEHTYETTQKPQGNVNNDSKKTEDDKLIIRLTDLLVKDDKFEDKKESSNFNLQNRRRYIPKGMSPIFENCNLKNVCNYEFGENYFEETVYDNFIQNVQLQTEVFKPKIENVKEAVTKDIQRVDNKLNKDNACFTFNGESLKHAKVLRQVDYKFIATILRGNYSDTQDCLVLFDQHAVHERIRLEQNMSEYLTHDQWKSVSLDGVLLKLTKDEILYLHNHKEKFKRLGLQWCISGDTQVRIYAIPEAILGKHPRQVDVVLKAVRNLIKEEINVIKEQGGCVSLYPKSIMDLVFSEACRYAIMFGDALRASECSSLVEALARCQTPFRCAHGRPSVAVLVDLATETRPYLVNFAKVEQFRRKLIKKINK